ncbi:MAG: putative DNA-binding domain-containing protein [Polyangiaceae bacterium]|nr:putative DNA-binding domain-containing protein [Polyangiaceae bacterium]
MRPEAEAFDPRLAALVGVVRRAAEQAPPPEVFAAELARLGVGEADAAAFADDHGRARLELYRTLVHGRIRGALEVSIPRTLERLGPGGAAALVGRFLAERGSRSPYLRDVAREVVDFAAAAWAEDSTVPPYVADLARYELVGFDVGAAEDDEPAPERELAVVDGLRFQKAVRLLRLDYAVHRLEAEAPGGPARGEHWLLAYRDAGGSARLLELTAYGAAAIRRLLAGESLADAARGAAADTHRSLDDASLAALASLLEELESRGALLGPA